MRGVCGRESVGVNGSRQDIWDLVGLHCLVAKVAGTGITVDGHQGD